MILKLALVLLALGLALIDDDDTEEWHAFAVAIREGNVAIGYSGRESTAESARAKALVQCRTNRNGPHNCEVHGPWNKGCVYVTIGRRGEQVGWGSGNTTAAALRSCRSNGLTCDVPVGGCVGSG